MAKALSATLGDVGLPRGGRRRSATDAISKEDSVAVSVRLPADLFVAFKTKVVAERTSIQAVANELFRAWSEGGAPGCVGEDTNAKGGRG